VGSWYAKRGLGVMIKEKIMARRKKLGFLIMGNEFLVICCIGVDEKIIRLIFFNTMIFNWFALVILAIVDKNIQFL